MLTNRKGIAAPVVLYVLAAVAATQLVPNWRVSRLFSKSPPTAELAAAEAARDRALADLAAIKAEHDRQAAEAERLRDAQLRTGQEYVAGTVEALNRVPAEHQTPETRAASLFAGRADIAFALALGKLPDAQRAEVLLLLDQLLSSKQAEIDAAMARIAAKDAELQQVQGAKQQAEARAEKLAAQQQAAEEKQAALSQAVEQKTAEVAKWADAKVAADREAGSLTATLQRLAVGVAALYVLLHYILPSLVAQFPTFRPLSLLYQAVASITSAHEIGTGGPKP